MMISSLSSRRLALAFRCQYEALRTLWTDGQTATLEDEILAALEDEFGQTVERDLKLPLQHAVGWHDHNQAVRNVPISARLRKARAKAPVIFPEKQVRYTPEKRSESRKQEKPQYIVLTPDLPALIKIIDSLQHQLAERGTQTRLIGPHLVRNKWTVLEFTITNGRGGRLHIVLNGSGPGRAAWTLTAVSAEQAVQQTVGYNYSPDVGMLHPQ